MLRPGWQFRAIMYGVRDTEHGILGAVCGVLRTGINNPSTGEEKESTSPLAQTGFPTDLTT